jgi:hypothetical protein
MFFFRRKPEPPKPDRLGTFHSIVDQALRNATTDREGDRALKGRLAEALENFARQVRFDLATR